jgi:hypothetical protein
MPPIWIHILYLSLCYNTLDVANHLTLHRLNVTIEWVALQLHIWEVQGSNLGQDTGYTEAFHGFPLFLQVNAGIVS